MKIVESAGSVLKYFIQKKGDTFVRGTTCNNALSRNGESLTDILKVYIIILQNKAYYKNGKLG